MFNLISVCMHYKSHADFRPYCNQAVSRSIDRLLRVTLFECGITQKEFCLRAGIDQSTIIRLRKGKYVPSFVLVAWIQYVCELYFIESKKSFLLPPGPIDRLF